MTTGLLAARPRPVFCVVDRVYRSRATADAARAGRFTYQGVTLELGVEPEWTRTPLPDDVEWQIEWSKFYYGLDLAHAFAETGDAGYLEAWERLVRSWIRQVSVERERTHVTGRRIQNWIYAWQRFAAAPAFAGLTEGLAEEVLASLEAQVRFLRAHLTAERNHRTLELYALFIAALALPELDPMGALRDFAVASLHANLCRDLRPDGVHREASTHYHMLVLRTYLGVRENARRHGIILPRDYDRRLAAACEFMLHCHRPDGLIPAISDSDTGGYADLLRLAADLLGREDFRYAATRGREGRPPGECQVSFSDGGYYIQRSGWGTGADDYADQRYLILDAGPLGDGGHGHYDLLSVELAANGAPLILDPGRFTYAEGEPNWRRWFKGTAAHNTVCVDRLDQTPYARSRPRGPVAQGELLGRWTVPGLDLLAARATSPAYDAVHTRRVALIADEYWLVADTLEAGTAHDYDLRYHLGPAALGRVAIQPQSGGWLVHSPGLALLVLGALAPVVEEGWISPEYGTRLPAPVLSLRAPRGERATFHTLLVPETVPGTECALVVRHRDETMADATVEIGIARPAGTTRDTVQWGPAGVRWERSRP